MTDKSAPPGQKKEDFGKLAGFGGDTMPQGTCDILYRISPYIYTFVIPKIKEVQQMYKCLIRVARNAQSTPINLKSIKFRRDNQRFSWSKWINDFQCPWLTWTRCWGSMCSWGHWSGWTWLPIWSWPTVLDRSPSPEPNNLNICRLFFSKCKLWFCLKG